MSDQIDKYAYAAIRRYADDGREFIDVYTIDVLPELAKKNADGFGKSAPNFHENNPVLRISRIIITEIDT